MKFLENLYPINKQQKIARHVMLKTIRNNYCATIVEPEDIDMEKEAFFMESKKLMGQVIKFYSFDNGKRSTRVFEIFDNIEVHEELNFAMFMVGKGFFDLCFESLFVKIKGEDINMNAICWN